jgi:DNA replication and repair protein RecF
VIDWFSLEDFRNISAARIDTSGGSIGIVGPNGSGKTSILEGLYLLGHGRSFRTAQRSSVIARFAQHSRLVCGLSPPGQQRIGMDVAPSRLEIRVGGRAGTVGEVASLLPIQLVDPSVHLLVEEGAARRRKLLDWGVFHVEPQFAACWRAYHRAVRQRNAALRAQTWEVADAIAEQLVALGEQLDRMRHTYFAGVLRTFDATRAEMLEEPIQLEYYRGWPADEGLRSSLAARRENDRKLRQTTVGPHRADLRLVAGSKVAREVVSRGQQKLLASALVLSQARYLGSRVGRPATLLLDDPAAELDVDNLGKLLRAVTKTSAQVIATSLTKEGLNALELGAMFHVKQGELAPML